MALSKPVNGKAQPTINVTGDLHVHVHVGPDAGDVSTQILAAIANLKGVLMKELDDLNAAETAEEAATEANTAAVQALHEEQATFLADINAKLQALGNGGAAIDPSALTPITAAITAQTDKLNASVGALKQLAADQAAADPGPAAAAPAAAPTA